MEFWKWYLGGLLKLPRYLVSPWGEYAIAGLFTIIVSVVVAMAISPWWCLLVWPVGITGMLHGLWRGKIALK